MYARTHIHTYTCKYARPSENGMDIIRVNDQATIMAGAAAAAAGLSMLYWAICTSYSMYACMYVCEYVHTHILTYIHTRVSLLALHITEMEII